MSGGGCRGPGPLNSCDHTCANRTGGARLPARAGRLPGPPSWSGQPPSVVDAASGHPQLPADAWLLGILGGRFLTGAIHRDPDGPTAGRRLMNVLQRGSHGRVRGERCRARERT